VGSDHGREKAGLRPVAIPAARSDGAVSGIPPRPWPRFADSL